ncbi:hypothetical protein ACFXKW_15400 [Streptomyces sp. NPDC059193]|uniref:hypothetical protein n=1 Tax=Streptomyces sp. NPDC059193 TaxID=3346763 RepID=UPI0036942044
MAQAQAVLDELAQPWHTMALLAFYTGLRWGGLSGLHGHRIDWQRGRLFVVEVNTKSGIKAYPKRSKSRREVPIPERVLDGLARRMYGRDRNAVVFTTVTKGRAGRLLDDGNWRTYTWWPAVHQARFPEPNGACMRCSTSSGMRVIRRLSRTRALPPMHTRPSSELGGGWILS